MRVPAPELVTYGFDDVIEIKGALLLRHSRVKDDLEQQVSELAPQSGHVLARYGIGDLVGLFNGVWRYGGKGLLAVPGTTVLLIPQPRHDIK